MTMGRREAAAVVSSVVTVGLAVATALTWSDSGGNPNVAASLDKGQALFAAKGCIGCHIGPDGAGQGISLVGVPSRAPDLDRAAYIRQSITRPGAVISPGGATSPVPMPSLAVSTAEVEALVQYLVADSLGS
jgi:mono/diheme cytochrome c family protein